MRLQTIDGETTQLRAAIAALPKRLASLETKLATEMAALEQAVKALKDEEALKRRCESDLKDQQQKIVKLRDQMSNVKTNEEYRAFQHEIEFAEAEIKKIEDSELESMERSEQLEQKRKAAESELKDGDEGGRDREGRRAGRVRGAAEKAGGTDEAADEGAGAGFGGTAADLRSRFDLVARDRNRVRAGAALHGMPYGHSSADVEPDSRGGSLVCESCGRLLFYDASREPQPEPVVEKPKKRGKAPEAGVE